MAARAAPSTDALQTHTAHSAPQAKRGAGRRQTRGTRRLKKGANSGQLDLCHLDEAGFALTLPPCYSWSPVGLRLSVPYQAPQGRRLNVIGGYISHGPAAGDFAYALYAGVPKSKSKQQRKSPAEVAAAYGLCENEIGAIDSTRLLAFLWQLAGRPVVHALDWKRACPLWIVLDNYSVHKCQAVKEAQAALEAADVGLFYLPAYSPELSDIEPIWQSIKHHEMPTRSYSELKDLKDAVETALVQKAQNLKASHAKTTNLLCKAA